jgi:hypothetical protein
MACHREASGHATTQIRYVIVILRSAGPNPVVLG